MRKLDPNRLLSAVAALLALIICAASGYRLELKTLGLVFESTTVSYSTKDSSPK